MREMEFLPDWYPLLRRRRRWLALQLGMSLALAGGLAAWLVLATHNANAAEQDLQALSANLAHTRQQLQQLDTLQTLEQRYLQQMQVLEKLGAHVEAARLLAKLQELVPGEVALLDLSLQIADEPARPSNALAAAADRKSMGMDRRMRVRLQGVAPTDVDLANFLSRLGGVEFFDQVALNYAKDRRDLGHLMREFEIAFCVPLGTLEAR